MKCLNWAFGAQSGVHHYQQASCSGQRLSYPKVLALVLPSFFLPGVSLVVLSKYSLKLYYLLCFYFLVTLGFITLSLDRCKSPCWFPWFQSLLPLPSILNISTWLICQKYYCIIFYDCTPLIKVVFLGEIKIPVGNPTDKPWILVYHILTCSLYRSYSFS